MPNTGKPVTPKEFGRWLDLTIENHNPEMTGKRLAELSGLDEAQISRWRNGRGKPSLASCERLANALGVDPMRLAVTAGVMPGRMAGAEPFSMPPNTVVIEKVRGKLRDLPGATEKSVEEMLKAFQRGINEE